MTGVNANMRYAPHPALSAIEHRPWQLLANNWSWNQTWADLLFAHWPIARDQLRSLVPRELEIDGFNDQYWIGVVPFWMENIYRRPFPRLPLLNRFCELNVRTYVRYQGKPGVYFFSLDAANRTAVFAARSLFGLPYYYANMSIRRVNGSIHYQSTRRCSPTTSFSGEYGGQGDVKLSQFGSLEYFLTERYCLFTVDPQGRVTIAEIHHAPWPLQQGWANIKHNTMTVPLGIALQGEPILHFAKRIDVAIWSPQDAGKNSDR